MEGGKLFLEKMIDMKLSISTEKLDWTLSRVFALFRKVSSDYPSKYVYHACMGEDDFSVHDDLLFFMKKVKEIKDYKYISYISLFDNDGGGLYIEAHFHEAFISIDAKNAKKENAVSQIWQNIKS